MTPKDKRDDFSLAVKESLKLRAAFICSNPTCRCMTIAPSIADENKVQYIGICAHITAAINGGPRFDELMTNEERANISNGIFLCSNCALQVDKNNGLDFSTELLRQWKSDHEQWILSNLNKSAQRNSTSINITSTNQLGGIVANVVNVHNSPIEKLDPKQTITEHDKSIFNRAESFLNEDSLRNILEIMMGSESIKSDNIEKIESLKFFYQKTSNQYISQNIETTKKIFLNALEDINFFIGTKFDMWPYRQKGDNYIACMSPQTNIDRGGNVTNENMLQHDKLQKSLYDKCNTLQNAYDSLRREIKVTLFI